MGQGNRPIRTMNVGVVLCVATPVVSELYKHVIYISHANEEGYWGTNPRPDRSTAGSVLNEQHYNSMDPMV